MPTVTVLSVPPKSEKEYGLETVDYQQMPHNFQRYSASDQTRIVARMLAVLNAHQQGLSLENAPPVENISLAAGLEQLKTFAVNIPIL